MNALGQIWHEYSDPPTVPDKWRWRPQPKMPASHMLTESEIEELRKTGDMCREPKKREL